VIQDASRQSLRDNAIHGVSNFSARRSRHLTQSNQQSDNDVNVIAQLLLGGGI
jgi:hypothetical protein